MAAPSRAPSRSSRESADAHSMSVAHQATMSGSRSYSIVAPTVAASLTSNGTSAELSQNLTVSSTGSTLVDQRLDGAGPWPDGWPRLQQGLDLRRRYTNADQAGTLEPTKPALGVAYAKDRLQACHRRTTIEDDDALSGPHPIDQRAQAILRLCDRRGSHLAILAMSYALD
jgi:hypothetical protein